MEVALEDYKTEMERCSQCSCCKWIPLDQIKSWRFAKGCPSIAYSHFLSYSARGRYAVALSLLQGRSHYTDRVLDIVYKCQACGSCDVSCKVCRYNLEPLETLLALRTKLVEDGQTLPQHTAMMDSLRKEGNPLSKPKAERGKWAVGLDIKSLTMEKAEVLFHAGCRLSYDKELFRNEILRSFRWLKSYEIIKLHKWLKENFGKTHSDVIRQVFEYIAI